MPTQRERELARLRARRQAERRAAAARRRRMITYVVSGVLVVAIVGTILGLSLTGGSSGKKTNAAASPSASASASPARTVACGAKAPAAPSKQTYAKEPAMTIDTSAKYVMKIVTSCGEIDVTMDAAKAPHTVNSFAFLASKHYFDGTTFHRSVASDGLTVLQGGDPTGNGSGGPGYTLPDENLKGATYPRGTLAMANTGQAHTGGSQFFLVDKASQLPASYTPFGTISAQGLSVLDKLIAIGNDGAHGEGDGAPLKTIYINSLTVTKL
jgi:peptidyl-prolyl cis-trans isomerase B (cyclophilin B)